MSFSEAIGSFFANGFNFKDRATRSEYWYVVLMNVIVELVLSIGTLYLPMFKYVSMLWGLIIFIPSIALIARRLHDVGLSGWLQLLLWIPVPLMFTPLGVLALTLALVMEAAFICVATIPSKEDPCQDWYKRIHKGQSLIFLISSIVALVLQVITFLYYVYKNLQVGEEGWSAVLSNELSKAQFHAAIIELITIILMFLIATDKTKRGIMSLVISALFLVYSIYLFFVMLSAYSHHFVEPSYTDISSIILLLSNRFLDVIVYLALFILCLKYFRGTLKITKMTAILCFAPVIKVLVDAVLQQIIYGSSLAMPFSKDVPMYYYILYLNVGLDVFFSVALLFRFKHAAYNEKSAT